MKTALIKSPYSYIAVTYFVNFNRILQKVFEIINYFAHELIRLNNNFF